MNAKTVFNYTANFNRLIHELHGLLRIIFNEAVRAWIDFSGSFPWMIICGLLEAFASSQLGKNLSVETRRQASNLEPLMFNVHHSALLYLEPRAVINHFKCLVLSISHSTLHSASLHYHPSRYPPPLFVWDSVHHERLARRAIYIQIYSQLTIFLQLFCWS